MTEKTFEQILDETGTLCYRTVGGSMRPLLREGRDAVVISRRPADQIKKYDAVLFTRNGRQGEKEYILHRILKVNPDGTYWVVGDNCTSGDTVRAEDILGVLTEVIRDGKPVTDRTFLYRVYKLFWCRMYPLRIFALRCRRR